MLRSKHKKIKAFCVAMCACAPERVFRTLLRKNKTISDNEYSRKILTQRVKADKT